MRATKLIPWLPHYSQGQETRAWKVHNTLARKGDEINPSGDRFRSQRLPFPGNVHLFTRKRLKTIPGDS